MFCRFFCVVVCALSSVFSCVTEASPSDILMSPQEFTDFVYRYCKKEKFDDFVEWIKSVDITGMNKLLYGEILIPKMESSESDVEWLRHWKTSYIDSALPEYKKGPFNLAVELFPYVSLAESTALSFDELTPIVKMCVIFSAKYGNPIAQNVLLFSSVEEDDEKLFSIIEKARADPLHELAQLMETPFVWNNFQLMNFLKTAGVSEKVFSIAERSANPFVALNAYFVASELGDTENEINFLQKAQSYGSALAFTRKCLSSGGDIPGSSEEAGAGSSTERPKKHARTKEIPPSVEAYQGIQAARAQRYSGIDRLEVEGLYNSALKYAPFNPSLHMEIASFWQDLFVVGAWAELAKTRQDLIKDILQAYKTAHNYGDGYAAEAAAIFIKDLKGEDFYEGFSDEWSLPHDNLNEALTLLFTAAYKRQEDEKFIKLIEFLETRTPEQITAIKLDTFSLVSLKDSVMKWRVE